MAKSVPEHPTIEEPTVPAPAVMPEPVESVAEVVPVQVAAPAPVTETAPTPPRHLPPIDMTVPGEPSPALHFGIAMRGRRLETIRHWLFRGAVATVVLVLAIGGLLVAQGYIKLHKAFHGGAAPVAALQANVNPNLLKGEGDGRINVLLLGRGGGDHEGPDLTDTIMVASIDPVNHTESLISVPRDLWVDIPDQGVMKVNAAWETGEFNYLGKVAPGSTNSQAIQAGFQEVDQVVEGVLGITIHYNMIVDFQAFQQAVDTVGGVTIDVKTPLVDPTMAWENHGDPVLASAGVHHFSGHTALIYARSRETSSDFARSQRQRQLLLALKAKAESLGTLSNPLKISGLINSFGNNVASDLSISEASRLYSIVKQVSDGNTKSVGLADGSNHYITTGNMNGQSIDLPTAGLFNYHAIQAYIRTQLPDGFILKEHAPILVLNGTDQAGLATTTSKKLKSYGYNIIGAADAPTGDYAQTTVIDLSHDQNKYTAHYLEQRFNTHTVNKLPDSQIKSKGAAFVIIVGSDATTSSQT
ncbi:MAG TPA: LCP family protein [Candidatus Saccharimonadales bacterium]|nr:LCP family protein [Candidatus Saccharimonadales bacterium]